MKTVHKSVLIWYSAEEMFALVTDVAQLPRVPALVRPGRGVEQDDHGMTAEVGIAFGGVRQSFTTRNTHVPDREVRMQAGRRAVLAARRSLGFHAPWATAASAPARSNSSLSYGFDNAALAALVGPVFDKIAGSLVDAFVKRAEQVYG